MHTTIVKWGNSRGVRLPKALLDVVGLSVNDSVEIVAENNMLIIKPTRERLTIDKLFADWSGEAPEPYDWGEINAPAGRELI
ncbi:MAG: AbrB/MazE/SpoVT family DNA-binding domain-containing protein [Clostridiales bacterium]|nr:AbrB/MazE/SpoVT family DNA-binding domain-containing protein [Clostridiales bacterium]